MVEAPPAGWRRAAGRRRAGDRPRRRWRPRGRSTRAGPAHTISGRAAGRARRCRWPRRAGRSRARSCTPGRVVGGGGGHAGVVGLPSAAGDERVAALPTASAHRCSSLRTLLPPPPRPVRSSRFTHSARRPGRAPRRAGPSAARAWGTPATAPRRARATSRTPRPSRRSAVRGGVAGALELAFAPGRRRRPRRGRRRPPRSPGSSDA